MTQLTSDIVTTISALGGVIGVVYATISVVKTGDKKVNVMNCANCHEKIELAQKEESEKRDNGNSVLHEKINKVSERCSKIEGSLSL